MKNLTVGELKEFLERFSDNEIVQTNFRFIAVGNSVVSVYTLEEETENETR